MPDLQAPKPIPTQTGPIGASASSQYLQTLLQAALESDAVAQRHNLAALDIPAFAADVAQVIIAARSLQIRNQKAGPKPVPKKA